MKLLAFLARFNAVLLLLLLAMGLGSGPAWGQMTVPTTATSTTVPEVAAFCRFG